MTVLSHESKSIRRAIRHVAFARSDQDPPPSSVSPTHEGPEDISATVPPAKLLPPRHCFFSYRVAAYEALPWVATRPPRTLSDGISDFRGRQESCPSQTRMWIRRSGCWW